MKDYEAFRELSIVGLRVSESSNGQIGAFTIYNIRQVRFAMLFLTVLK